ncbi:MAG: ATP-binding protein [Chloroflexota bacterium]
MDEPWSGQERMAYLEERIAILERMVRVSQIITSTLDLPQLLTIISEVATELTKTEAASIMLLDKNTGELFFETVTGDKKDEVKRVTVPLEGSIAGWIFTRKEPVIIRNPQQDPRHFRGVDRQAAFFTRSLMGAPLNFRGETIGVIEVINRIGDEDFADEDLQALTALASQAAIAIENARLLSELQRAYASLAEMDQVKSDFVAIASHELRTPLNVILGYATFLKDDLRGDAGDQLEIVLQSAMRLRSLIDDMVNLRHLDTGEARAHLELTEFPVHQLVTDVIQEFSGVAEARRLSLSMRRPSQAIKIVADRQKIYLVLVNLLSNALKFTPSGGRVLIVVEDRDTEVWVAVRDTGIGIPAGKLDRIFERFYQVEGSLARHYEGMGLGLSIAKGMVELHGGRIWAESVEGMGSSFTVALQKKISA